MSKKKTTVKKHPRKTKTGRTTVKRHPRKIKALKSEYKIAYQQKGKKSRDADELETSKDLIVGDEFDFPAKKNPQNKTQFLQNASRKYDWEGIDDSKVKRVQEINRLENNISALDEKESQQSDSFDRRKHRIRNEPDQSEQLKARQLRNLADQQTETTQGNIDEQNRARTRLRSLRNEDL